MTEEGFKRKLTAILSADAAGYSRLMGENEASTVQTLTAYQKIMTTLIQQHRGRVVDSPGDNLLAEFSSVVDALECAVSVQEELQDRNAELPDEHKMEFRIGINLGDVIQENDRIYGNGVNVASRLEGLADPGGICISESVRTAVGTNLSFDYEFMGEHSVKNITRPIWAYRIISERASLSNTSESDPTTLQLPDKPSIAVLPFTNMSGDPEQEYFSDGITEDIITALSRSPWLFVISRNSSFVYRGAAVDAKKVSRELGVRYILEGSVRKAGNRIRVTAQLIDGLAGDHVWAEKYDGELQDIFDLQDNITQQVVASTQTQIQLDMGEKIKRVERPDIGVWDILARAWKLFYELNEESLAAAEKLLRKAVASDQTSCQAHWLLSGVLRHQELMGYASDSDANISQAYELAKRAVFLDEHNEYAHWNLGGIEMRQMNYDTSIAELKRAIELNPNCSLAYGSLGNVLAAYGKPEESIKNSEIAIRLNPKDPSIFFRFFGIANAHFVAGRYEEAAQWARKSVQRKPQYLRSRSLLIVCLAHFNELEEARKVVEYCLKNNPDLKISDILLRYKKPDIKERFIEGLRKAGFPE